LGVTTVLCQEDEVAGGCVKETKLEV